MIKIHHVVENLTRLFQPGTVPPVDIFPFLHWLPERFWGNWRTRVQKVKDITNSLYAEYLDAVIKRRAEKGSRDSYADRLLDQQDKLGWNRHEQLFMSGILMDAGSDTTSSALSTFIHLMAKYPEVAKEAQAQIDGVVGEDRSPTWDDFENLPFINSLIKEMMRFRPISPLAFPHNLSEGEVQPLVLPYSFPTCCLSY
jgi:cytochrome P450